MPDEEAGTGNTVPKLHKALYWSRTWPMMAQRTDWGRVAV